MNNKQKVYCCCMMSMSMQHCVGCQLSSETSGEFIDGWTSTRSECGGDRLTKFYDDFVLPIFIQNA